MPIKKVVTLLVRSINVREHAYPWRVDKIQKLLFFVNNRCHYVIYTIHL
jgi:hypothetical protein